MGGRGGSAGISFALNAEFWFGLLMQGGLSLPLGDREVLVDGRPRPLGGIVRHIVGPSREGVPVDSRLVRELGENVDGVAQRGADGQPPCPDAPIVGESIRVGWDEFVPFAYTEEFT